MATRYRDHEPVARPSNDDPRHQPLGTFAPGAVASGYHMDLRGVAGSYGPPEEAEAWFDLLAALSLVVAILCGALLLLRAGSRAGVPASA